MANKNSSGKTMNEVPYSKFSEDDFTLRDYLAIDRTILANERTYLAYIRTALTTLIVGVSFVKFFDVVILVVIGWIFIPISIITFIIGTIRFKKYNKQIYKFRD